MNKTIYFYEKKNYQVFIMWLLIRNIELNWSLNFRQNPYKITLVSYSDK